MISIQYCGLCIGDRTCLAIAVHGTHLRQIRTKIDPLSLSCHNNHNLYQSNAILLSPPALFTATSPRNATADHFKSNNLAIATDSSSDIQIPNLD